MATGWRIEKSADVPRASRVNARRERRDVPEEAGPTARRKRRDVSRTSDESSRFVDWVMIGIAVFIGLAAIGSAAILPLTAVGFMALFFGLSISIFGFVKGCLATTKYGNYVSFDYLEFLGGFRYVIFIGACGWYVIGYLALWTITQLSCGLSRPKEIFPWIGLQAYGFLVILAVMVVLRSSGPPQPQIPVAGGSQNQQQPANAGGSQNQQQPAKQGPTPVTTSGPADASGRLGWWKLDEGQGTKAEDSSGQGHPATVVNALWVEGANGKGLSFIGKDSYLDYGDSPAFSFPAGGDFTFVLLVRTRADSGTLVSQRNSADGSPVIDIAVSGGKVSATVRCDGNEFAGPAQPTTRTAVNDGNWHQLALTRNGNTIELYLDGVLQEQSTKDHFGGAITTDLRTLASERYWLKHAGAGNPHFEGGLGEFAIYNRALKAEELQQMGKQ